MKRQARHFIQTSHLLKEPIRQASATRGFSETRLLTHWVDIAGVSVANMCKPVKINYARYGVRATLVLLTTSAYAPIVQMQLPQILNKVNSIFGYNAIQRIKITQTAEVGFCEPVEKFDREKDSKLLSNEQKKQIEFFLKDVFDTQLRDALIELGNNILKGKKND